MIQTSTDVQQFTIASAAASFERDLKAVVKSPRTIESYLEAVRLLARFVGEPGMPADVTNLGREHIESFLISLQGHYAPNRSLIASVHSAMKGGWRDALSSSGAAKTSPE